MLWTIVIVGLMILWAMSMYFNHKEKIEKINAETKEKIEKMKLEDNPLNKIFGGNKNKED